MKLDLRDYPTAGPVAARAVARAKANGMRTIFNAAAAGGLPDETAFMRRGRRSWTEWWSERFPRVGKTE